MGTTQDRLATVAARVRFARERAGLSQRQLSRAAGLSPSTVANIENETHDTRLGTLKVIAGALGASHEWLLLGTGEAPSASEASP